MIDHTNSRIEENQTALRRAIRRRYAFQRMLQATDRLLWRLEEMNRDGVTTVPKRVRTELRDLAGTIHREAAARLRDTGEVQETLDSLFDVQEELFRWRFPDWRDWDPDSEADLVAS